MTKEELTKAIEREIKNIKNEIDHNIWSNEKSDAMNRVAISNLYVALSNLIKE